MTAEKEDGGSAFPRDTAWDVDAKQPITASKGMSLRDYCAAAALQGIIASSLGSPQTLNDLHRTCVREGASLEGAISASAFNIADAMIKARQS